MNPIDEQRAVIDKLYQLVLRSAANDFTEAACRFRYLLEEDGSRAVDEQFWYFVGEDRKSAFLDDDRTANPMDLVPKLHSLMKDHTGGDWDAFTLTIGKDGKVTTKFEYPN